MRGKAVERALIGEKLFPSDIDDRVRKVCHWKPAFLAESVIKGGLLDPRTAQASIQIGDTI